MMWIAILKIKSMRLKMLFKYKGFDQNGSKVKGKLEADSFLNAKARLKYQNIICTQLKESQNPILFNINFLRKQKIKPMVLATISRDISIYLKSGIALLNAIKLINERYKEDKKLNLFFDAVILYLDEGKNFYTALSTQNVIEIPEFYLQSIKISEEGGMLENVLDELGLYLKEQDKISKQIRSATAYPMFITLVSFIMVGFMLSYIVPKITSIFKQNSQQLPEITEFIINVGDFTNRYFEFVIIGLFIVCVGFIYGMRKSYKFKYNIDRFLLRLPFFGKLIEIGELSRFAYMNSILIRSGVPLVQAFKLGSDILKNSVIKKLFTKASSKVVEGEKLSKILETSKIYKIDSSFIQAISIGEETSELNKIFLNIAMLYKERNSDKIGLFLTLLEPMLMLVVGIIIGFIVLAMLLPIFSMNLG